MTTVDRSPWAMDDMLALEPGGTAPAHDLTPLDDGPPETLRTTTESERSILEDVPTSSPLAAATSAVSAWAHETPCFDPTEPPPELRTVATDAEQMATAAMSHRRLVSLEVHPEVWLSDPADVTDAIINAVNTALAEHESAMRAELESAGSGIGAVTKEASELHEAVAEALGRELDDVIASVSRGGAGTTVQPTEARS